MILAVSIIPLADALDNETDASGEITLHFREAFGTGLNGYGQLGNGSTESVLNFESLDFDDAVAIYPTSETVYYLTSDGRLFGSGHNDCGQLGTGDTVDRHEPVRIGAGLGTVVYVTCGPYDVFFINSEGELFGTGGNSTGRFGNGSTENVLSPIRVGEELGAISKACIVDRTLFVLNEEGDLYGAGANNQGIIGNGKSSNQTTFYHMNEGLGAVVDVRISKDTALWLNDRGELFGCGRNDYGQLGQGDTVTPRKTPVRIGEGIGTIVSMECTYGATYMLTSTGDVYACGGNGSGQLGTGTVDNALVPTQIGSEIGKTISKVSVAYKRTTLLASDGSMYVCGINSGGQNGDGSTVNTPSLQLVDPSFGTVADIFCSELATYFVNSEGVLYGAGKNVDGALGIGESNGIVKTFTVIGKLDNLTYFSCCATGAFFITDRQSHVAPPGIQYAVSGSSVDIQMVSDDDLLSYSVVSCSDGTAESDGNVISYSCPTVQSPSEETVNVSVTNGMQSEQFPIDVVVVQVLTFVNSPSDGRIAQEG